MSKLADRIIEGLGEALARTKGEEVPDLRLHVPASIDVAAK